MSEELYLDEASVDFEDPVLAIDAEEIHEEIIVELSKKGDDHALSGMNVIFAHGLLSAENERELIIKAQGADTEEERLYARNKMIESNMRLVLTIARGFRSTGSMGLDDLVQEGSMGLIRAIEKFDPNLGFKFSTYAYHWVKQFIERAVENRSRVIRIPVHVVRKIKSARRSVSVAEETGVQDNVDRAQKAFDEIAGEVQGMYFEEQMVAIDQTYTGEDGERRTLADVHESMQVTETPEDGVQQKNLANLVKNLLPILSERHSNVLRRRYGMTEDGEPMSLNEIAEIMGVTRERVRQIQGEAERILANHLKTKGINSFMHL